MRVNLSPLSSTRSVPSVLVLGASTWGVRLWGDSALLPQPVTTLSQSLPEPVAATLATSFPSVPTPQHLP